MILYSLNAIIAVYVFSFMCAAFEMVAVNARRKIILVATRFCFALRKNFKRYFDLP